MKIVNTICEIQNISRNSHKNGKTVAVVPTMGNLHEGHFSLIDVARQKADVIIITIFVNPTQFSPNEDFDDYPRSFEEDYKMCCERTTGYESYIFAPNASEMYPESYSTWVVEEELSVGLCGNSRPSHFKGVTTVVAKLFNATLPDIAVFGQKDAQQAAIIKRMVRDLNFPIEIIVAPIVREKDGLAMSSRNSYLSNDERINALTISKTLFHINNQFCSGTTLDAREIKKYISDSIISSGGKLDYVEIVDPLSLKQISDRVKPGSLIAVAAFYGKTRLIDNILICNNRKQ